MDPNLLLPASPYGSVDEYVAAGGGRALAVARDRGAGCPAARKWRSVASGGAELGDRYVVANGAEGEPGTFKDRPLLRANPYQVIEGDSIAATVVGAREAFIA